MPRTVFAASATAFSAAFAKLSLEVPTTSIIFCVIAFSFDFDFSLWSVPLVCAVTALPPGSSQPIIAVVAIARGVPLAMGRIRPENLDPEISERMFFFSAWLLYEGRVGLQKQTIRSI